MRSFQRVLCDLVQTVKRQRNSESLGRELVTASGWEVAEGLSKMPPKKESAEDLGDL